MERSKRETEKGLQKIRREEKMTRKEDEQGKERWREGNGLWEWGGDERRRLKMRGQERKSEERYKERSK